MRPLDGKPTRRGLRRAARGVPTGRRATHVVETTYGHQQRVRDAQAEHSAFCAERRRQLERCACCELSPDAHNEKPCVICGHNKTEGAT